MDIVAGTILLCVPLPGARAVGASMLGAGLGGIAGGYAAEAMGGSFETGAAIGSIVGAVIGGSIYRLVQHLRPIDVAKMAQGKTGNADDALDWDSVVKKGETRYEHVMKHATAKPNKMTHTVFNGNPIDITNQAWAMRGDTIPVLNRGAFVYRIPFPNAGVGGLNAVKIVVMPYTNKLISAYPIFLGGI